jgi:hypothetical protein
MFLSFNQNVPNGPDDPSDDQPIMLVNSQSTNTWPTIDHFGFNDIQGGYHKIIHQPTNASSLTRSGVGAVYTNPVASIANVNQIIAGVYTTDATVSSTDTQLFSLTGNNVLAQLTGFNTADLADGWCWVGGVLIQWGTVSFPSDGSHSTHSVTFKDRVSGAIPFPNNCFNIQATLQIASSGTTTASNTMAIRSKTTTGFVYVYNSSASNGTTLFPGFYWVATGN